MDADDASSAEMHPRHDPQADPLALDEETAERLLSGQLPADQAPPGYAEVAALLAATAGPPTPEELAGKAAALAELRAVTRARAARSRRAARPPRRRRRFGLAAVVVVGALVTGGAAAAATGHLPAPVREAARSILDTGGRAEPAPRTSPGPAAAAPSSSSTPGSSAATSQSSPPTGATGSGPSTTGAAAAAPNPNLEALCQSYLSGNGAERGKKLDSAAFQDLVRAAGGKDKVEGYCQRLLPEDKKPKEKKQPAPTDDPGEGPGGPPPTNGGGGNDQGDRADARP